MDNGSGYDSQLTQGTTEDSSGYDSQLTQAPDPGADNGYDSQLTQAASDVDNNPGYVTEDASSAAVRRSAAGPVVAETSLDAAASVAPHARSFKLKSSTGSGGYATESADC